MPSHASLLELLVHLQTRTSLLYIKCSIDFGLAAVLPISALS